MTRAMKRPMTLDLDSTKYNKKGKVTTLLTSPDLNMLKLASPELERMIIAQHGLVTSTPTPSQCMYPQKQTEDRHDYHHRDFPDALGPGYPPDMSMACQQSQPPPCSVGMDYNGYGQQQTNLMPPTTTCYSAPNYYPMNPTAVTIKEEPQTVPCMGGTPPLSPIDMENQERIKLERKRMRNRIAASKCRRRKLERIARLEDKVALLKGENSELTNVVNTLREQVCNLKQQVMDHMRLGCEILNFQPDLQF